MSRRPSLLTQSEVRRAVAAAKQAGASYVEIMPDGVIRALFSPLPTEEAGDQPLEQSQEIVL